MEGEDVGSTPAVPALCKEIVPASLLKLSFHLSKLIDFNMSSASLNACSEEYFFF